MIKLSCYSQQIVGNNLIAFEWGLRKQIGRKRHSKKEKKDRGVREVVLRPLSHTTYKCSDHPVLILRCNSSCQLPCSQSQGFAFPCRLGYKRPIIVMYYIQCAGRLFASLGVLLMGGVFLTYTTSAIATKPQEGPILHFAYMAFNTGASFLFAWQVVVKIRCYTVLSGLWMQACNTKFKFVTKKWLPKQMWGDSLRTFSFVACSLCGVQLFIKTYSNTSQTQVILYANFITRALLRMLAWVE